MQVRRCSASAAVKGYAIADPSAKPHNILEKIVWQKEREVAQMYDQLPLEDLIAKLVHLPKPRDFRAALQNNRQADRPALIAEVKKASPSRGILRPDFDPAAIALAYARGGASCLSVLCDREFFQGGFENLQLARAAVDLPLLCKEFIIDPYQIYWARLHGADAVLLIAAILSDRDLIDLQAIAHGLGMTTLVEVHMQSELVRVLKMPNVDTIGINNRNLEDFTVDLAQTQILLDALNEEVKQTYLWVSESGLYTRQDLAFVANCGCGAVLIGESLVKQPDIEQAVQLLLGN
ncbi:indole-3-glycerol phosphate synthase TrpC [Tumidithrix helvetica PCC 7403]|uniref:indole-3-glycerol phosphate synthase TrpC n=1 Tax=Tumidithrix helvetica TaxID=3457545 RepID=UPI003CA6CB3C